MKHTIETTTKEGNQMQIEVRAGDSRLDKFNGHSDFAITATIWGKGKVRNDRNMIAGGCCHDEILKARPDLKLFVDLHLADVWIGCPMYAIENGFYHLQQNKPFAQSYIRANDEQWAIIKQAEDKLHFQYLIEKTGLVEKWAEEAKKARQQFEAWTGKTIINTTTRPPFVSLGDKMAEIESKLKSGFYSEENKTARAKAKQQKERDEKMAKLEQERDEKINSANTEFEILKAVLDAGLSLKNVIYYNHTREIKFNWLSYEPLVTADQLETFKQHLKELNNHLLYDVKITWTEQATK